MSQTPDAQTPSSTMAVARHFVMPFETLDLATPIGQIITHRLSKERLMWLTTIDQRGVPQPLPVTFLWDSVQGTILTYSRTDRGRLADLEHNPNVAVHFDASGGDIIVITGVAAVSEQDLPSDQIPEWVDKYRDLLACLGITAQQSAASASVAIRIRPVDVRYAPNPL